MFAIDPRGQGRSTWTPVLLTRHFHMTDPGTGRLMGSTGQSVAFRQLDAPHTMHEPMAQQYADVITEWIKTLA
ncbi:hypothetical protein ACFYM2_31265 [Streptomyces sp. NPDC006711]|uniref:hypothetical protein n=1 Tax=Streptomyces sp. NPDC006711 TaxID=3364762 RepID=UPI0036B1DF2A